MKVYNKEYWDSLIKRQDLYNEFNKEYEAENGIGRTRLESNFGHDPELKPYYQDNEFKEVAQNLRKAAAPVLPILRDILKHLPGTGNNDNTLEERAKARIISQLGATERQTMSLYVATLLLALESDLPERLESGMNVPKDRAARRAYKRFKAFKAEELKLRKAFETTQEYRTQRIEVALGIRDHIEYPKE